MNDFIELKQIFIIAFKRWYWLVLATVVGAALGYFASQRQTTVYEATTTVMVGSSLQAADVTRGDIQVSEVLALTYADMTRRQPVLQEVINSLDLDYSWQRLKERISANLVPGTQSLQIKVEGDTPEEAQVVADELTRQLILLSPTSVQNRENEANQQFVRQRLSNLQAKIEGAQQRLEELEALMSNALTADRVQKLQSEINMLERLMTDWEDTHTQLLIFIESKKSPNQLFVIEPAQVRTQAPRTQLLTALGAIVGFALAAGLIFLLEALDETIKKADELANLELASLGVVSRMPGRRDHDKLIINQNVFSPAAEAYRMIRSNLQFLSVDNPLKSVVVTSASPTEGKSITVANLGISMGQAGFKTIIVDADLRSPALHQIFQVTNKVGLTDALCAPTFEISDYLKQTMVDNLQLLPSGTLPPNPAELLGTQKMQQILQQLEGIADVVIYDSPPASLVTDAAVLASRVDGVILVIRAKYTHRDLAKQTVTILQQARANLIGGILNNAPKKRQYYRYLGRRAPIDKRRAVT